jgi:hypothetical protein
MKSFFSLFMQEPGLGTRLLHLYALLLSKKSPGHKDLQPGDLVKELVIEKGYFSCTCISAGATLSSALISR